jgi:hypothetical protein
MEKVSDETLILKLSISRDVHSEFMRKLLGKHHYETVFGEHNNSLQSSHSSSQDPLPAPQNHNIMSLLEFCVLCDSTPSPIPGSPLKKGSRFGGKAHFIGIDRNNSSQLTDLNCDYGIHVEESSSRSTLASPGKDYLNHSERNQFTVSSSAKKALIKTDSNASSVFEGMIKLDNPSRNVSDEIASIYSASHNHLVLNIASASTKLEDSSFHLAMDNSMSSSLSTPTIPGGSSPPSLSRSNSQGDNNNNNALTHLQLQLLRETSNESFSTPEQFNSSSRSPQSPVPSGNIINDFNEPSSPFPNIGLRQQPIKAKRNPKIEKMISEVSNRRTRSSSPKLLQQSISRSLSGSHSSSFYETSNHHSYSVTNNCNSSSHLLEGIALTEGNIGNNNNSRFVSVVTNTKATTITTTSSSKPNNPFFSLFPIAHSSSNASSAKKTGSVNNQNPMKSLNPSIVRLTSEEMISNKKLMARRMREVNHFFLFLLDFF